MAGEFLRIMPLDAAQNMYTLTVMIFLVDEGFVFVYALM